MGRGSVVVTSERPKIIGVDPESFLKNTSYTHVKIMEHSLVGKEREVYGKFLTSSSSLAEGLRAHH
ncbi:hypothetical protein [Palaeococcus sp. (in: euryarchaeotes)]